MNELDGLDFEVDQLTNSILNSVTGDSFSTEVIIAQNIADIKGVTKSKNWQFDWKAELKNPLKEVYKLTITKNEDIIQGLISLEIRSDHIYMHLLESAPFNKGNNKVYVGVPGNLVAFACKLSFQRGFEGNVSFTAKSALVNHFIETLGAMHIGGRIMIINSKSALKLTNKYFPK